MEKITKVKSFKSTLRRKGETQFYFPVSNTYVKDGHLIAGKEYRLYWVAEDETI